MRFKSKRLIRNLSYSFISNITSLVISILVTLIVPKIIGVEDYGYWQIFILYTSYVGILHFGWNDGIYLRYGGYEYQSLDKRKFHSQFYMLVFSQFVFATLIFLITMTAVNDKNRIFIIQMTALDMIIVNARYMLLFILQATSRIKENSLIVIFDRSLYIILIIIFLLTGFRNYKIMIMADLISKFSSLIIIMYICKDIVFRSFSEFYLSIHEMLININAGIKLMISNIASRLVVGVVKFGIEQNWDVTTFGKASLTISISKLVLLMLSAIGVVMYPILRKVNEDELPKIFLTIKNILMFVLLGSLIGYYPIKVLISEWLPEYADSLKYMGILMPIIVFEGKMSLLLNVYLKALRKEKLILLINFISLVLSFLMTIFTTYIFNNLLLSMISIPVVLALRCLIAEIILSGLLRVSFLRDILLEFFLILIFVLSSWFFSFPLNTVFYVIIYLIYLFIKRNDIHNSSSRIRSYLQS